MSRSGQCRWSAVGNSTREICSIVADLNHGKCSKETKSSSSPVSSQSPWRETLDTSTREVLVQGIDYLLLVICNQLLGLTDDMGRQASLRREFDSSGLNAGAS